MATRVVPIKKAVLKPDCDGWQLQLHWARYIHEDGNSELGYRFMWRRPDGSLQAARGQARIPSLEYARQLMTMANKEGWGEEQGTGASKDVEALSSELSVR